MNYQAAPQSSGRAIPAPDPSSTISPTSNSHSVDTMPSFTAAKETFGGVMLRMQDNESDRASICRSPGWKDSRKRKKAKQEAKEARKQEKERAAIEIKELRQPSRLTKAPPTSKGVCKHSASTVRSDSAPMLHTSSPLPDTRKNKIGSDSRRTSNDAGSRKFMPWKSANIIQVEEAELWGHQDFIGGLKLQQATQAIAQHTFRKEMTPAVTPHKSNFVKEFADTEAAEGTSSNNLRSRGLNDASMEQMDEAKDRNSFSSRASRNPESTNEKSEVLVTRGRKGRLSTSKSSVQQASVTKHITGEPQPSPDLTLSRAEIEDGSLRKSSKPLRVSSSERPPVSYREPRQLEKTERRPRRGSFSFLLGKREQSKDRSTTSHQEEFRSSTATTATSTDRHSRSSSWSFPKGSRISFSRPTTAESFKSIGSNPDDGNQTSFDSNGRPYLTETVRRSKESASFEAGFPTSSHLQGFKTGAKDAFSRYSKPSTSLLDLTESWTAEKVRPTSVNCASPNRFKALAPRSPCKAEKTMPRGTVAIRSHDPHDTSSGQTGQSSKSSSLNDSSDEYHSLLDEKPTMSMPAASESQSETSYSRVLEHTGGTPMSYSITDLAVSDQMISGAMQRGHSADGKSSRTNSTSANHPSSINAQDLSFLPPLKHQPLTRPLQNKDMESSSANYFHNLTQNPPAPFGGPLPPPTLLGSCSSSSPPSLRSSRNHLDLHLHNQRQILPTSASKSRDSLSTIGNQECNTQAKMFVICCNCRYFHDMPSKVYECIARPDNVVRDPDLGVSGVITTRVKCPWCEHGMSNTCCEGWAAVVVLKERLH